MAPLILLVQSAFLGPEPSPLVISRASLDAEWTVVSGDWQASIQAGAMVFRAAEAYADVGFSAEFNLLPEGDRVRTAILACRSTGSRTFSFAHLDSRNRQVILVRSDPRDPWNEIRHRAGVDIPAGEWSTGEIR